MVTSYILIFMEYLNFGELHLTMLTAKFLQKLQARHQEVTKM